MAERWAIWYAVEGDLRFCSHHELMRAMERLAARARLPLRYSQGFNPRPQLSLVCPRPVGLNVREDLLVAGMESPEQAPPSAVPLREAQMLDALNRHAATGLRFVRARRLEGKATPRPIRIQYELPLDASQQEAVRGRLGELASQQQWLVDRLVSNSHRPVKQWDKQHIDIKPLIEQVDLADARLTWTARRQGEAWARPGELLALVGLDSRTDLARVVRTFVTYENDPLNPAGSAPESPADTSAAERGNEQGNIDQHR